MDSAVEHFPDPGISVALSCSKPRLNSWLNFCFKAIRKLLWNRPRNSEPQSDESATSELAFPLNLRIIPRIRQVFGGI
ncbi:hypothetical protein AVEN_210412-1, partial [Araneus ventricosus]